ncbi:glycosyltransferase family 9 protein [Desulfovibrio oxamicus]|uniref:Glycosyltransferase family 9 protein n=1 Tax=Nitratidesulfovibrio oxamicus TaxID=32016 RepID=A0ABS0J823_9BACT|nr:glycosyltransferase family 9 protein [Nitratidesulfovibrio oxamicus]MBG3878620.1 glycosyltransferase family 9 protein [Nitratidesulfovibrio oxamicus]
MNDRHRILIIKLAALGDAVMASTMLPALRERWSDAHITWLCGRGIAPLVHCFEGIDEIVTLDERRLLAGSLPVKVATLAVAMAGLAGRSYDLCLVAHKDWRYRLIPSAARCRAVRALGGRNGPVPGRWHGDEYRRLALGEDGPFTAPALLARLRGGAQGPSMKGEVLAPVLLVPGGARNVMRDDDQRRWPVGHYRELAASLLAQGVPVTLVGGAGDRWAESAFAGLGVTSCIGRTDIAGLLALLARAAACVTHDTGPLHLACLAGTPTVALFGPTLGSEKVPPYARVRVLSAALPCVPCYDGRDYASCLEAPCMQALSPEMVSRAVHELLQAGRA